MFGLMEHEGRDRIGTKGMGFPYLVQRKEKMEGKEFAWLHLSSLLGEDGRKGKEEKNNNLFSWRETEEK